MPPDPDGPKFPALCLFFGAGASADAGVPTTAEFVTEFRKHLDASSSMEPDKSLLVVYDLLIDRLNQWLAKQSTGETPPVDIELMLQVLETAAHPEDEALSALVDSPLVKVGTPAQLIELGRRLRVFVREQCVVDPAKTGFLEGLLPLLTANPGLPIFSVNYDLVVEHFLYRHRLSYVDGIDLKWNLDSLLTAKADVYLCKLHGSVNWYRTAEQSYFKLPIFVSESNPKLLTGELAEEFLLYPDQKWAYSGPAWDLLGVLRQQLAHAQWFIIVGYSFRDYHFVRLFLEAGLQNPRLRVVLVGPSADSIAKKLTCVSPPNDPSTLVPSRLDGRVLSVPFRFGRIVDGFYHGRYSALTSAVYNFENAREMKARGGAPKWDGVLMELANAGAVELMDKFEEDEPLVTLFQPTLWSVEYRLKRAVNECIHKRPTWRKSIESGLTELYSWMTRSTGVDLGSLPSSIRVSFWPDGEKGPNVHALLPSEIAEMLERVKKAAAGWMQYLDPKNPSDHARHSELTKFVSLLSPTLTYLEKVGGSGLSPTAYLDRARTVSRHPEVVELQQTLEALNREEAAPPFETKAKAVRDVVSKVEAHAQVAALEESLKALSPV